MICLKIRLNMTEVRFNIKLCKKQHESEDVEIVEWQWD